MPLTWSDMIADGGHRTPGVTVIRASPCFVYPHTNIPRDKSTPGGDTYNTRSERMQYSKYEQEESHLSVPLFSGIKYLRFYSY